VNSLTKIIGLRNLSVFILLIFLIFLASIFEAFSISIIIPLMSILTTPNLENYPEYIIKFINFFNIRDYNHLLKTCFFLIAITFILRFFIFLSCDFIKVSFSSRIRLLIQIKLFNNYIKSNFSFYQNTRISDLVKNILNESLIYSDKYFFAVLSIISESLTIIFLLALLFFYNFQITITVLAIIVIVGFLYFSFSGKKLKILSTKRSIDENLLFKIYYESLNNLKDIKVYNAHDYVINKAKPIISETIANHKKLYLLQSVTRPLFEIVLILSFLIFSLISIIYFKLASSFFITTFALFSASAFRIVPSLARLLNYMQDLKFSKSAKFLIEADILNFQKNMNENTYDFIFDNKKNLFNQINIENIKFSYGEKKIFHGANLEICRNKIIGIKGVSGSGKSTLINIIMGLIKPHSGKVLYIIDKKIFTVPPANLFSYVPQEIFLLDDTIMSNIAFGKNIDEIDLSKIQEIIKKVELDGFIETSPYGLNTIIGDKAKNVSGGQAQRIALARALYHGAEVLILDEFSNQLDQGTETKILKIIENLRKTKTIIIISHKKNTMDICDIIYKIQDKSLIIDEK
jgi:ABC-type multidrug transport system fused ATPase/permease subunit